MTENLTIALLGRGFGWSGGVDFLRHVANGLLTKQQAYGLRNFLLLPIENKIESPVDVLRVAKRSAKGTIQRKRPWFARPRPVFHESMLDFFQHTRGGHVEIVYHESSNSGLLRCLRRIKADVVLPVNGSLGGGYPVPWVGYAPDFQHRYFPENFSSAECLGRDSHFDLVFKDSIAAIVNSKSVKDDVFRFYPHTKSKIFNLPFSPNPLSEWFEKLPFDIHRRYGLPEKYFLISNQFWVHKDHLTAFRALALLGKFVDVGIVCTGTMSDYRKPNYMAKLKRFLSENDLTERVILLGHIPKREQIEIMKKAVAVVQPTLFEGGPGGGCVYDAVSLGVPVILSDIPVNMEVKADNLCFFRAGDSQVLAEKMLDVLKTEIHRPTKEDLLKIGQSNLEKLGDCLLEAIYCVV